MKPHRIRMTHNLLLNYGLYRKMEIYVSISEILYWNVFIFYKGFKYSHTNREVGVEIENN